MQAIIGKYSQWFRRKKQRRWRALIEKHYIIAKTGRIMSAKALRVYEDRVSFNKIRLVRIQLHIDLLNGAKAVAVSKCLLRNRVSLEGKIIRFKFSDGDLSQIVLCL